VRTFAFNVATDKKRDHASIQTDLRADRERLRVDRIALSRKYEPMQRMETGNEQFNSGVQIDIRDGQGRIHLTGKMIPPLNSGGADGWWALEDLQLQPERITARYRVNALSHPSLTIDRRSGLIEIKGLPGFSGKCDVGDWGAGRKF
jgi:hypothetical protein